jgi:glycosyltransferase involved in cell wall biosynthesis
LVSISNSLKVIRTFFTAWFIVIKINPMCALKVHQFERCRGPGGYSMERLFHDIRLALPADIDCVPIQSSFLSKGFFRRAYNVLEARGRRGPVNHVVGDVHFLTFGLPAKRTILTVHDCGNLHRLKGFRRWLLKTFWFTLPLRKARIVTTISEATKLELVTLVKGKNIDIRVIPNCVSREFVFTPLEPQTGFVRLMMIGTKPNKNIERMTAALAGLPVQVELVGILKEEQRAVFALHRVPLRELGYISNAEVEEAYRRCDVLAFCSTLEGFGMPVLEAQATGRAVVTSTISSLPEVAGDAACLVDPYDVASMHEGFKRVVENSDYRQELIAKGLVNAARYTPERIAEQYAQVYREVANSPMSG